LKGDMRVVWIFETGFSTSTSPTILILPFFSQIPVL